jgi:hypothetical protein
MERLKIDDGDNERDDLEYMRYEEKVKAANAFGPSE